MTYGENYALPRTAEPDEHRIQISDTFSKYSAATRLRLAWM